MGKPKNPESVRLIIGMLFSDHAVFSQLCSLLQDCFGPVDVSLDPIAFEWTNYYQDELGTAPLRAFLAFENRIPREEIVDIKLWTNGLEDRFRVEGKRAINLDPGYMTLGQFFLATTKDQRQRVYIRDGIYVEPTLYFQDGQFQAFPWTYRDYASPQYLEYLQQCRERFAYQRTTGKTWRQRAV